MNENTSEYFQLGSTMKADAPSYVRRRADNDIYQTLQAKQFCYVFNCRQMGKSSLAVKAKKNLEKEGFKCAVIDLPKIGGGKQITLKSWYKSIVNVLADEFYLDLNLTYWWQKQEEQDLTTTLSFTKFIRQELLGKIKENVIIFIDEIDTVINLKFPTEDFFAAIRSFHTSRAEDSGYDRLTFCLLGVVTPTDLIRDEDRTPFNIGKAIELSGFTLEEAKSGLLEGLEKWTEEPEQVLKDILWWTSGQPFLTQKLCDLVAKKGNRNPDLNQLVQENIINHWQQQDNPEHLGTIRDRLLANEQRAVRLLGLYRQILLDNHILADNSPEQAELRLSGLVTRKDDRLTVFNPIYKNIFDLNWVEDNLAKIRPYAEKFQLWQDGSNERKQLYLLYGNELDAAQIWKEGKELPQKDNDYLSDSLQFWQKAQSHLPKNSDCETIIKEMNLWTGGERSLNDSIFEIARDKYQKPPEKGQKGIWVDNLVRKHLLESLKRRDNEAAEKINKLRNRLIEPQGCDSFWLLVIYRKLLRQGKIKIDDSAEQQELIKIGLVVQDKEEGALRVSNRVYEEIFNQNWVARELNKIRPHATQFITWLDSNRKDKSQLLSEQKLQQCLEWGDNEKGLKESEQDFLIHSLIWNVWRTDMISDWQRNEIAEIIKKFMPSLQSKAGRPYRVIQQVLSWIPPVPSLAEAIFQLLTSESVSHIPGGEEETEVQRLIKSNIIDDWENHKAAEPLRKISVRLRQNEKFDPFWLMLTYLQVSQSQERIKGSDNQPSETLLEELCDMGMVYSRDNETLKVYKLIEAVLDFEWIKTRLEEDSRPHASKLAAWVISDSQDQSQLLQGRELEDALSWADGQGKLEIMEQMFLAKSQLADIWK